MRFTDSSFLLGVQTALRVKIGEDYQRLMVNTAHFRDFKILGVATLSVDGAFGTDDWLLTV